MPDNTLTIQFKDDPSGKGAGHGGTAPTASPAAGGASTGPGSTAAPVSVQLTAANAKAVADALAGKLTADQFLQKIGAATSTAAKHSAGADVDETKKLAEAISSALANPKTTANDIRRMSKGYGGALWGDAVQRLGLDRQERPEDWLKQFNEHGPRKGGGFDWDGWQDPNRGAGPAGPQLPQAKRIPTATFTAPAGGDQDIQRDLQRQYTKQKAAEDRAAAKAQAEADRQAADAAKAAAKLDAAEAKEAAAAAKGKGGGGVGGMASKLAGLLGSGGGGVGGIASGLGKLSGMAGAGAEGAGAAAGLGEGAAAGMGSMAAAAGPVAAIIGVALAINAGLKKVGEAIRGGITAISEAGQSVAHNDSRALATGVSDGIATVLEKTGGVATTYVAQVLRTVTAAANAFADTVNAFVERGRQLQGYSGDLAGANAQADVSRLLADIKEAQVTGPRLGQLTRDQSELESFSREIMLFLKTELIGGLQEITGPLAEMSRTIRPLMESLGLMKGDMSILAAFVRYSPPGIFLRLLSRMVRFFDDPAAAIRGGPEAGRDALTDDFLRAAAMLPIGTPAADQRRPGPGEAAGPWFREPPRF